GSRNLGGLQVPTSSPPVAPSQLCHPPSRLSSSLFFWDEMPLAHTATGQLPPHWRCDWTGEAANCGSSGEGRRAPDVSLRGFVVCMQEGERPPPQQAKTVYSEIQRGRERKEEVEGNSCKRILNINKLYKAY
ncbi:hypothetical protein KUCAC02_017584, partial [Chaenocephalus aceratus]